MSVLWLIKYMMLGGLGRWRDWLGKLLNIVVLRILYSVIMIVVVLIGI